MEKLKTLAQKNRIQNKKYNRRFNFYFLKKIFKKTQNLY